MSYWSLDDDFLWSVAHATEAGVNIRVMGLEPIAEGRPQHAGGGARRAPFHHVVPGIKEIGGVAGIERKGLEAGERGEHGGGPLPSIANHLHGAEGAPAVRESVDRGGIPALKIGITGRRVS